MGDVVEEAFDISFYSNSIWDVNMDLYGKIGKFDNKWKGRQQMEANQNEKERQI
jgi:hypothetical protein